MEKKIRKTHTLDKEIYTKFQQYAICIGRSVSSLIEEHMREVISKIEKGGK